MRFILVIKYGLLQTKTERIDVNFCQSTQQLLEYIAKRVGQNQRKFIARVRKGKVNYRIVHGWSINHYGIKEGMQIDIELLEDQEASSQNNKTCINQRYLNNILGFERENMQKIEEEERQSEIQEGEVEFNVRKYLDEECQQMLKEIQRQDVESFLDVFQDYPEDIEEAALVQLQKTKPMIINELGEKGWGALHYAIFCKASDIFQQLLDMYGIDVNKCTSDGWLPVQLAIDQSDTHYLQQLLTHPNINLNLVTSKGSALHFAAKSGNKKALQMLFEKEVDIQIKDNHGKTPSQVCSDDECLKMLKRFEDKKQTYHQYVKGDLPISLTTIVRGVIMKAKRPFMNLKDRYLLIDPFQGSMIRFESVTDYPKRPKEITPLRSLSGLKIVEKEDMAFYMKRELVYFTIQSPNRETYACKYRETAQKWIKNIRQAARFAQELQKNPQFISQIRKNQLVIQDSPPELQKFIKKIPRNIFNQALGNRNSRGSVKSRYSTNRDIESPIANRNSEVSPQASPVSGRTQNEGGNQSLKVEGRSEETDSRKQAMQEQKDQLARELAEVTSSKVNFSSFSIIKTLGSGAFGKVFLARLVANDHLYALKALKKKNLILQKQLKYAIVEANILKQANHPNIINLHFAFQTPQYLYLALDYCPGKDLSFHLAREVTFPESQAKFYIAQLVLAIEHLHQKNIIYRDLKPENILLDAEGNVKLADFGLSKQTEDQKSKSFCGSPAYLSPEMLSQKGAGRESDLYGIGAVLYEFLVGEPPYFSDDIPTLYKNIKEGKLRFPKGVSQNVKSLIIGLLQRDPKRRLGSKNWDQIKNHSFFSSISWQKLRKGEVKPPERPQLSDDQGSEDELDIIKNTNNVRFNDFDYDESTKRINRLINFSFVRPE